MNALLEKNLLTKMVCGSNLSYILTENSMFLTTEYKVLQSQGKGCFVKCMKMTYNGKIQLYYLTGAYKSLSTMLPTLDGEGLMTIVANLFSNIIEVKNNGFLACQNIDISLDNIYIEPANYQVHLMYLPLSERIYGDYGIFENEIRTELIKVISDSAVLSSPKTMQLVADLSDGTIALEALLGKLKGYVSGSATMTQNAMVHSEMTQNSLIQQNPQIVKGILKIIALNAPSRVEINVTKDKFILGKNPSLVDGVLSFNNMISRKHCEISKVSGGYFVTDLGSANGTYVNRKKIQPGIPCPVGNGDIIRLANSDFQVVVG